MALYSVVAKKTDVFVAKSCIAWYCPTFFRPPQFHGLKDSALLISTPSFMGTAPESGSWHQVKLIHAETLLII